MDIFNGLFCAEGSYKQFKRFAAFAMLSNEEDRRGTSDNDTVVVCRDSDPDPRILQTIRGSVVTCAKPSVPDPRVPRRAVISLRQRTVIVLRK